MLSIAVLGSRATHAATKMLDLDGNPANGAESQCDLNVLATFPVQVENKVTNRAAGDSYSFEWRSAGPGGFISSVPAGTTGGVGSRWVWTTNQSVFSYSGGSCANDMCAVHLAGPSSLPATCTAGCFNDGIAVRIARGATVAETLLSWPGGTGPFTIYRSATAATIGNAGNAIITTDLQQYTDVPPPGSIYFYKVTGQGCVSRKPCTSDSDCNLATEGTCASVGPFGVPGRSLLASDVTVSAASLTSSLITFFSPYREVFKISNSVTLAPTGIAYEQALTNPTNQDVTAIVAAYPPGCCNEPHQLNCDGTCVDYLTDSANCGACGHDCGDGFHCDNGNCRITCAIEEDDCDGVCVNFKIDRNNCGGCGVSCTDHQECTGSCVECRGDGDIICNGICTAGDSDPHNCGACGVDCNVLCEPPQVGACSSELGCFCVDPDSPLANPPVAAETSSASQRVTIPVTVATRVSPPAPLVDEAPKCELQSSTTLVPAGGTTTDCQILTVLAKEVPTSIAICGTGIPDGNARCANGDPATQGTFMKLIPDPTKPVGDAYITPYRVHVTEPGGDGMIQPGEMVHVVVEVLNSGPFNVENAVGTLISPPVVLTDGGSPASVTISSLSESFGDIRGVPIGEGGCAAPRQKVTPAHNEIPFEISFPLDHPGETSRPFVLQIAGIVNGSPFSMDVPLSLGIADSCNFLAKTRDFDGLDGLLTPMAKMVPENDDAPLPNKSFPPSFVIPLELHQSCGGVELGPDDADAPQIVGLVDTATETALDITLLTLNDDTGTNNPFFHWDSDLGRWVYHLRTAELALSRYTLKIRIAGGKVYDAAFIVAIPD